MYFLRRQEIRLVCVVRIDRPNPIESEWLEQTLGRTAIESLILQLSDAARKGRREEGVTDRMLWIEKQASN